MKAVVEWCEDGQFLQQGEEDYLHPNRDINIL